MLNISNLSVAIGEKKILNDLSLQMNPGEIHVIMGANGSGKSTLLKTLAGHPDIEVSKGDVSYNPTGLNGKDLLELEPYERSREGVFLSFQDPVSLDGVIGTTFYQSIYKQACQASGAEFPDKDVFKALIAKKLESVGLPVSIAERFMNVGFSGGEKKRHEIFQMLLLQPKLIMLDEIDSGLDVDAIKLISSVIKSHKSSHNAFLIVTHYRRLLEELAPDHLHILSGGKLTKSGGIELLDEVESQGYSFFSKGES